MEKATSYINDRSVALENDIWRSWQRTVVQTVSETEVMEAFSNDYLRLRVPRLYRRHVAASRLRVVNVRQERTLSSAHREAKRYGGPSAGQRLQKPGLRHYSQTDGMPVYRIQEF